MKFSSEANFFFLCFIPEIMCFHGFTSRSCIVDFLIYFLLVLELHPLLFSRPPRRIIGVVGANHTERFALLINKEEKLGHGNNLVIQ